VQDLNYGSVQRYSSSLTDQVKRPRDPVRQVYDRLKGDAAGGDNVNYNSKPVGGDSTAGSSKDGGAWATGVRHFEKSPPKASSFESLHSELRKSKGLSALAPKDTGSPTWGEMRFFQEKPKQTSPLDLLRDRMQKVRGSSVTRDGTIFSHCYTVSLENFNFDLIFCTKIFFFI